MKVPVVYVSYVPGRAAAPLRDVLGEEFRGDPLPFVGAPIDDAALEDYSARLTEPLSRCSPGASVVFHDEKGVDLQSHLAIDRAVSTPEVQELMADFDVDLDAVDVQVKRLDRCSAVLVQVKGAAGMPPGLVVLVDHASLKTFPRRFIDLGHLFFEWEEPS